MGSFVQFGMVLLIVLVVSIVMRILRQPLVIGYILSGILVGPFFLNLIQHSEGISVLFEISVAFLLFIVGLHLSPKVLKEVGKISFITGLGQMIFTFALGYLIGILFGFSSITSFYIAMALTFSSTIVIMKFLSDTDALGKLYGKISVGFILVQDLVAILLKVGLVMFLIIVSLISINSNAEGLIALVIARYFSLFGIIILFSYYFLPRLVGFFARSQELLFLFIVSWGFGLSMLFAYFGFSIEIGALIAGIALSLSPYSHEIGSKLKPLRDFFVISFFIILGSQILFNEVVNFIWPIFAFSLLILIGSPLIMMILMGCCGYSKRVGFMTGLTVAQIGEFSLIFIMIGVNFGHISQEIVSFMTVITLFTILGFTYLSTHANFIFNKFSKFLSIFEKKNVKKDVSRKKYDYILLGYNRVGFSILKALGKITKKFLVIDYNPSVVKYLKSQGVSAIYGDVDDSDFIDDLNLGDTSMVVSTIPDFETNQLVLNILKRKRFRGIVILTSGDVEEAFELYNAGADYVILPHFLGGEYASKLILEARTDKKVYTREKRKEIEILKKRKKIRKDNPEVDENFK